MSARRNRWGLASMPPHAPRASLSLAAVACFAGVDRAGADDRTDDWTELSAASPKARAEATARLRGSLKPNDVPELIAVSRRADVRSRRALAEILLDRQDLALAYLPAATARDEELTHELARGVRAALPECQGYFSRLGGDARAPRERARGGALRRVPRRIDPTRRDGGRAALGGGDPYPILVDPAAPEATIELARAVFQADDLALRSFIGVHVSLASVGRSRSPIGTSQLSWWRGRSSAHRRGARAALVRFVGFRIGGLRQTRAATAILALGLAPFDAFVVEALASESTEAPVRRRADAAFDAVCAVPLRGASLLAASPRALDGFLGIAVQGEGIGGAGARCPSQERRRGARDRWVAPGRIPTIRRRRGPRLLEILARRRAPPRSPRSARPRPSRAATCGPPDCWVWPRPTIPPPATRRSRPCA